MMFVYLAGAALKERVIDAGVEYRCKIKRFVARPYPHGMKLVTFHVRIINYGVNDQWRVIVTERTSESSHVILQDDNRINKFNALTCAESCIAEWVKGAESAHD